MKRLALICLFLSIIQIILKGQSSQTLSGGMFHTLYLCKKGTIFSWGDNSYGQLGRNPEKMEDINPGIIAGLTDIRAICAGKGNFSLAIKNDGSLWSWGQNSQWQLGSDTACTTWGKCDYTEVPVQVKGGETGSHFLNNVIDCAAGLTQSYALLSTGEVVAWGDNYNGQLGNGTNVRTKEPVYILKKDGTKLINVKYIAVGALFAFAITNDGKVWGWGKNTEYELGCGNNQNQLFATEIIDKNGNQLENIVTISCGLKHAIFLTQQGQVFGTGAYKGETWINGTTYYNLIEYATPLTGINNVKEIASGFNHNILMTKTTSDDMQVYTFGNNKYFPMSTPVTGGQLGINDDATLLSTTPILVKTGINTSPENIIAVFCTNFGSFVQTYNKTTNTTCIFSSGINSSGQLGTHDRIDRYAMTKISLPGCSGSCPTAFLGDYKTLCNPIIDTLKSGYSNSNYKFQWFKNDIKLMSETKSFLSINGEGKYTIEITDTLKSCKAISDEIFIKEKIPNFSILDIPYCKDSVTFKTVNNEQANWYSKRLLGKYLGSGSIITVAAHELQTSLPDSSKTIWMYTSECQPIPVVSRKKCTICNLTPPSIQYEPEYCLDSILKLKASGQNIRWYNKDMNEIISISNVISIDSSLRATYTFHATQSDSICESLPVTAIIQVKRCLKRYSVEGFVIPSQKTDIIVYDYNKFPSILLEQESDEAGYFKFEITDNMTIAILAKPQNSLLYSPTYFGNKESIAKAYPLKIDANVMNAEIDLLSTNKVDICNKQHISVYPSLASNYCIFTKTESEPSEIIVLNEKGIKEMQFTTQGLSTLVITQHLRPGIYYFLVKNIDKTIISGSFIKE